MIALVAILAYWPGLGGELIFDDRANLEPLRLWLAGDNSWQQVVFGNDSGPLGRPLTMASFLANVSLTGDSVWWLKVGNLALHLLTGGILYALLSRLALRDPHLRQYAHWVPGIVAALWLLHPFMVGTVLYVVQRMAMLSALFMIATMLAYLHGRTRLEQGHTTSGTLWLFLGVPALTALAALSKENGLLAPLLCGVLEWAYFAPRTGASRPRQVRLFLAAFIAVPLLAALALLVLKPEFYFAGYANRPFGPVERVLTQSRILFDYLGNIVLPNGTDFSLLKDDYKVSTGLFSPPTTSLAILAWLMILALAIRVRRAVPGFSAGVGIFLVGHLMESTIFPLLLYFEHRNYLPAIGVFWSAAAIIAWLYPRVASTMDNPRKIFGGALILLFVVLTAATYARSTVWQSAERLALQSLQSSGDSRHVRMELARIALAKPVPDVQAARTHARHLTTLERSSTRLIGHLMQLLIDCQHSQAADAETVKKAFAITPDTMEADLFHAIDVLTNVTSRSECKNLRPGAFASYLAGLADTSSLSENSKLIWRIRFNSAKLYYQSGNLPSAREQAEQAWRAGNDNSVGMMLAGLEINLGQFDSASNLLEEVKVLIPTSDRKGQQLIDTYEAAINQRLLEDFRPGPNTPLNFQLETDDEQ